VSLARPCEEVTLTFLLSEFPEFLTLESEELLPEFLMEESEELFPEFLIELFPLSLTVLLEFPLSFIEPPAPPNAVLVFVVFELSVTDPPFATGALTFVLLLVFLTSSPPASGRGFLGQPKLFGALTTRLLRPLLRLLRPRLGCLLGLTDNPFRHHR